MDAPSAQLDPAVGAEAEAGAAGAANLQRRELDGGDMAEHAAGTDRDIDRAIRLGQPPFDVGDVEREGRRRSRAP